MLCRICSCGQKRLQIAKRAHEEDEMSLSNQSSVARRIFILWEQEEFVPQFYYLSFQGEMLLAAAFNKRGAIYAVSLLRQSLKSEGKYNWSRSKRLRSIAEIASKSECTPKHCVHRYFCTNNEDRGLK